jgi:hypothetical protein
VISTMNHLPFPGMTAEQRDLLRRWLYAAASRESYLQLKAARAQDRVRHSIRANAFRDAVAELTEES